MVYSASAHSEVCIDTLFVGIVGDRTEKGLHLKTLSSAMDPTI
jgi:hypothetical protein